MITAGKAADNKGDLLLRMRCTKADVVESSMEIPYEIHLVSFPSEADFADFMKDEARARFMHLKVAAIREGWMVKGQRL